MMKNLPLAHCRRCSWRFCWIALFLVWSLPATALAQVELLPLEGHTSGVSSARFSPDGKLVVTGSFDRTLKIYNVADGSLLHTLSGHDGQVLDVNVTADGRRIISGARDKTVRLWDMYIPTPLASFAGHEMPVGAVAVSADDAWIATGSADKTVKLFNRADGALLHDLAGHTAEVQRIAIRSDNQQLASGDAAGVVRFWNPADGSSAGTLGAHAGGITGLAYHPTEAVLITSGDAGTVKRWALPAAAPKLLPDHEAAVSAVAISADGQRIATGTANEQLRLFDAATGEQLQALEGQPGPVHTIAFSADASLVISGSQTGVLKLWTTAEGADAGTLLGHTGAVHAVDINPQGDKIASAGEDGTVRIWRSPATPQTLSGHTMPVTVTAVSADGKFIATGSADKTVRLIDPAEGTALQTLEGHAGEVSAVTFNAEGTQLASGDAQGSVHLFSTADGAAAGQLHAHTGEVTGLAYSPDATTLYTSGADGTLKWWQLPAAPDKVLPGHEMPVAAVAISDDGKTVVTGSAAGAVRAFNGETGEAASALQGQTGEVTALALSKDASLTAAGSPTGAIRLWNTADGADRLRLSGHNGPVRALAFHPEGSQIASAGEDGTLRIWRLPQPAQPLAGHEMPVTALAMSGDETLLVTGSADMTVKLWNRAEGTATQTFSGHAAAVGAVAISADNAQLASGDAGGEVRLWNAADGADQGTLLAHDGNVTGLSYATDGSQLFTASADGTLKWWQLPISPSQSLAEATDAVTEVALSADGKLLAAGGAEGSLLLLDAATGQPAQELAGQNGAVTALAIGGGVVATGNDTGEIRFWNAADGADRQAVLGHAGAVNDVALLPESSQVISAGADGTVRLWKLPAAAKSLAGDALNVSVVAFSGDGSLVASGGMAGGTPTIIVRDAATGAVTAKLLGHEGAVTALAFSADKTKLISGSADKTARVWNLADAKFPEIGKFTHPAPVTAVALAGDAAQAFSAAGGSIRQWTVADGEEVRALEGHTMPVRALEVTGATLYSGAADGSVRAWNVADGKAGGNFPAGAPVTSLAVNATAKLIAAGTGENNVKLLSTADGKVLATLGGHAGAVAHVAISGDGQRIAGCATDGLRVWNAAGVLLQRFPAGENAVKAVSIGGGDNATIVAADAGHLLRQIPLSLIRLVAAGEKQWRSLALLPDGSAAVVGAADGSIQQFNTADGEPGRSFAGADEAVHDLAISSDGKQLAAACADNAVRLWDLSGAASAEAATPVAALPHPAAVQCVRFDAAGTRAFSGTADNVVRAWDIATGRALQRFADHTGAVQGLALAADGKTVYSASADKTIRKSTVHALRVVVASEAESGVADLAVSNDGKLLATVAGATVNVWDAATGGSVHEIPAEEMPLTSVAMGAGAGQVAAGSSDGSLFLWPLTADGPGEAMQIPTGAAVHCVCYGGEGQRLAVGGADNHLRVYDSAQGRLLEDVTAAAPLTKLAFSAEGTFAAAATGNNATLQPLSLVRLINGHEGPVTGVAYTGDGTHLISGGNDKTVRRWNAADATQVGTFAGPTDAITSLGLSADGEKLVAGSADQSVYLWPVAADAAAEPVAAETTFNHAAAVRSVSAGADGTRIASAGDDNIVRVWDAATGRQLQRFQAHTMPVLSVAMAADNKSIVSGSADMSARLATVSATRVAAVAEGAVNDLALSADGKTIVLAGEDNRIQLVAAAEGEVLHELALGEAVPAAVAIGPDNAQLAAVASDANLRLWPLGADGPGEVVSIVTPAASTHLDYDAAGAKLAVAGADGHIRVFDPAAGRLLEDITAPAAPGSLAFLPAGDSVVTSAAENALLQPLSLLQLFAGHEGAVTGVAFVGEENALISGGADKTVRQWNLEDGTPGRTFAGAGDAVADLAVAADGSLLVAGSVDQNVYAWDLTAPASAEPVQSAATLAHAAAVHAVSINADGTRAASASDDGIVRVWDMPTARELQRFRGHEGAALDVALAADGKALVSGGADMTARAWSVAATQVFVADTASVTDAELLPDGSQIATAGAADMLVKLWDAQGQMVQQFEGAKAALGRLAVRGDGAQLAANDAQGRLLIWTVADAALTGEVETAAAVHDVAYSPDHQKLAVAGAEHLRVYQPEDRSLLQEVPSAEALLAATFTSGSREIVTGGPTAASVWAFASPTANASLAGHEGPVYAVAASPDNTQVASAGGEGTIRIWNTESGESVKQLAGHTGAVYGLVYSADGSQLLSAGADGTTRLWNVAEGSAARQFAPEVAEGETPPSVYDAAISADGKLVAAAGRDNQIRIWNAANGELSQTISEVGEAVYRMSFNPGGTRLLTCGHAGNLVVWNTASGEQLAAIKLPSVAYSASYAPDGTRVVAACADGKAYIVPLPAAAQ